MRCHPTRRCKIGFGIVRTCFRSPSGMTFTLSAAIQFNAWFGSCTAPQPKSDSTPLNICSAVMTPRGHLFPQNACVLFSACTSSNPCTQLKVKNITANMTCQPKTLMVYNLASCKWPESLHGISVCYFNNCKQCAAPLSCATAACNSQESP